MANALTPADATGLTAGNGLVVDPRLRALFDQRYREVWRLLRRFGVDPAAVDDAAQRVFWIAAQKLDAIERGKEFAFLYGISTRVAAEERRKSTRHDRLHATDSPDDIASTAPTAEEQLDQQRARSLLDEVLDRMPDPQREVFVLFELEGLEIRQIASLLDLPIGTVGSRLRSARETFTTAMDRLKARLRREGGTR